MWITLLCVVIWLHIEFEGGFCEFLFISVRHLKDLTALLIRSCLICFHAEYEMLSDETSQNVVEMTMMTERHLQQAVSSKLQAEEQTLSRDVFPLGILEKTNTDLQDHPSDIPANPLMLRGFASWTEFSNRLLVSFVCWMTDFRYLTSSSKSCKVKDERGRRDNYLANWWWCLTSGTGSYIGYKPNLVMWAHSKFGFLGQQERCRISSKTLWAYKTITHCIVVSCIPVNSSPVHKKSNNFGHDQGLFESSNHGHVRAQRKAPKCVWHFGHLEKHLRQFCPNFFVWP